MSPIVYKSQSNHLALNSSPYANERELQELLSNHPDLLILDGEHSVVCVTRELNLEGSGIADLLVVDSKGLPIVVEVKLARNVQSRREVVAQIFDYVSALMLMTADELDESTSGALKKALSILSGDSPVDDVWRSCATNLRAGRARVVIAVDKAPADLLRIIRFVNDHSDLDVRLIEVQRYWPEERQEANYILVPTVLVHGGEKTVVQKPRPETAESRPEFLEVVQLFIEQMPRGLRIKKKQIYAQVIPDGWPTALHFEFLDSGSSISVELHIEADRFRPLAARIQSRIADLQLSMPPDFSVSWDPRWSSGRGRIKITGMANAKDCVAAMNHLISATRDAIEEEIASLHLL